MNIKVKKAIEAIEDIFSDTSVSQETTLEQLDEVLEYIGDRVDALEEQIRRSTR